MLACDWSPRYRHYSASQSEYDTYLSVIGRPGIDITQTANLLSTYLEPIVRSRNLTSYTIFFHFGQENVQLHLKSTNGPIEVYLCPEEILEESPAKESSITALTHQESRHSSNPPVVKGNEVDLF